MNLYERHPEFFVCQRADGTQEANVSRPAIPPEYYIDWSSITTVQQAKEEHTAYVASIRTREGIITGYLVTIEGVNFVCWNNMQKQIDTYQGFDELGQD